MTERLLLAKMHGAGNDFVVLPGAPPSSPDDAALVRALADRRFGVGGDGVLFVERIEPGAVRMHFYNSDGGRAGLCLNGSRCVALRAVQLGWAADEVAIHAEHQVVRARVRATGPVAGAEVELEVDRPRSGPDWIELPGDAPAARGARVDTGDPHLVVEVDADALGGDFVTVARRLRHWKGLGPAGANVHFVERGGTTWRIRSFERGVEDETLACGSGCISSAAALAGGPVDLLTRGGAIVHVDPRGERWTLRGPATLVFETEWTHGP